MSQSIRFAILFALSPIAFIQAARAEEAAVADATQPGLPHVTVELGERLGRPLRPDPGLLLDPRLELVVGERQHPAVGVVDQDDLGGAQQPLTDRQRADLVVCDDAARVADHVRLALLQAEDAVDVQPGVHAGHDSDVLAGRHGQRTGEGLRVLGVVGEQVVSDRHVVLLEPEGEWNDHEPTDSDGGAQQRPPVGMN